MLVKRLDRVAYAVMQEVNKANCKNTFEAQMDRVQYFKNRIAEKQLDPKSVIIILINVDSLYGSEFTDVLMPGHDWQQYRDKGEVPFGRGLVMKEGIIEMIATIDEEAAEKIKLMKEIPVVVMDYNVIEVFSV
jgi:hypothetical protein